MASDPSSATMYKRRDRWSIPLTPSPPSPQPPPLKKISDRCRKSHHPPATRPPRPSSRQHPNLILETKIRRKRYNKKAPPHPLTPHTHTRTHARTHTLRNADSFRGLNMGSFRTMYCAIIGPPLLIYSLKQCRTFSREWYYIVTRSQLGTVTKT